MNKSEEENMNACRKGWWSSDVSHLNTDFIKNMQQQPKWTLEYLFTQEKNNKKANIEFK